MKILRLLTASLIFMLVSPIAKASLNLNVKIGQLVGSELVQIDKTIAADYDKEIEITSAGLKNKIILSFKKFSNVLVNGKKINPVQIDMKLVDEMKKIIGRPQTVTSFYNRTAQFAVRSTGIPTDMADMSVSLNFEEN
jgi:hypothetical protein